MEIIQIEIPIGDEVMDLDKNKSVVDSNFGIIGHKVYIYPAQLSYYRGLLSNPTVKLLDLADSLSNR